MSSSDDEGERALQAYLASVGPEGAPSLTALHRAVTAAHAGFDVAVKYRLLMYALDGDWQHWVCAIGPTKKGTSLRFLYGVILSDPRGVLRQGSANLTNWDFGFDEPVDADAVGAYVREAVAVFPEYRVRAAEINAQAKADVAERAAQRRGQRRAKG